MVPDLVGLTISTDIIFTGVIEGFAYALIGLGLVLVYRATGVINFANGQIGAFGAYVMAVLFANYDIPYGLSLPLALACGGGLGAIIELLVVRRLFTAPRLLLFVATLGVAQLIVVLQLQLPTVDEFLSWPQPINSEWSLGGITLEGDDLLILVVAPLAVLGLAWLLQRTRFGLSVRSAADNPSAASLAGISIKAVSTQVWTIAGVLSTISVLLIGPVQNLDAGAIQTQGPKLLLLSLAAAMFGRLSSFGWTLVGGIVIGVVDRFFITNTQFGTGVNLLVLFILVVVLVLVRGRDTTSGDDDSWNLSPRLRAAREELAAHPLARWVNRIGIASMVLLAVSLPLFVDTPSAFGRYGLVVLVIMVALSTTVLTGWAGQLSLGQFAFAALGALFTAYYAASLNFFLALGLGVAWGVGSAILMGIPALRIRGLYLAIITLAFAVAVEGWAYQVERVTTGSSDIGAKVSPLPVIFGYDMRTDKQAFYYLTLVALAIVIYLLHRLRRSGVGRTLVAVRDNELAAAAYTVSPTRAKLIAFAVAGGVAALAGGLMPLAEGSGTVGPEQIPPAASLLVISVAVVGGISSIVGTILGGIVIIGIPAIFEGTEQIQLFASGVGMLIVLMYFPGGLISIVHTLRDLLLGWIAKRTEWTPPTRAKSATVAALSDRLRDETRTDAEPLRTRDVVVSFGGRRAVAGVDIHVEPGEIVGLIGTNGAGKTTLMNAISGFVPSSGEVSVFGDRVDGISDYKRARHGIGRAFQNARLFGSLTVRETLMVALEARERSLLLPSMIGLPPSPRMEKQKREQSSEIIDYLGLGRYADTLLSELSTGSRRIVELGALIALDTQLMLLDEPTAGVAQRETEAFGPLIKSVQAELGSSILIIEHDMPMVMSISDRIYCLEAGAVIAEGSPGEVRENPLVVASYLGTDERAVQRSGTVTTD